MPASGTIEELLADDGIDIVVNLTLPSVHAEVDLAILAAGKHVWSEKPIATNAEDARRVLDAAEAAGLRVAVAPDTVLGAGLQTRVPRDRGRPHRGAADRDDDGAEPGPRALAPGAGVPVPGRRRSAARPRARTT